MPMLNAEDSGRAWETFVLKCDELFGLMGNKIAALSTELERPPVRLMLDVKLLLAAAYSAEVLEEAVPLFFKGLRYLPRYISDPVVVRDLNRAWQTMLSGVELSHDDSTRLDEFLAQSREKANQIEAECTAFLEKVKTSIPSKDPLLFHKVCILLGADFDQPTPSIGRTILGVLFPSQS